MWNNHHLQGNREIHLLYFGHLWRGPPCPGIAVTSSIPGREVGRPAAGCPAFASRLASRSPTALLRCPRCMSSTPNVWCIEVRRVEWGWDGRGMRGWGMDGGCWGPEIMILKVWIFVWRWIDWDVMFFFVQIFEGRWDERVEMYTNVWFMRYPP